MRRLTHILRATLLMMVLILTGRAQSPPDTLRPRTPSEKPLPEIQLQEYTIVGLARIELPRKIRSKIFKEVAIHWVPNRGIWQRSLPPVPFRFTDIKPSFWQIRQISTLRAGISAGSFNTVAARFSSQFRTGNWLPYFTADLERSDGHLPHSARANAGGQAGVHYRLKPGHLLTLGGSYQWRRQEIWKPFYLAPALGFTGPRPATFVTRTYYRDASLDLQQQWSGRFSTRLTAGFSADANRVSLRYADRGGFAGISVLAQLTPHLSLTGNARYDRADWTLDNGNVTVLPADSLNISAYRGQLLSALLTLRQRLKPLTLELGVRYQQSREEYGYWQLPDRDQSFTNPYAALSLSLGARAQLFAGYRPSVQLPRLRELSRLFPYADISHPQLLNRSSYWNGGIKFQAADNRWLQLSADMYRAENMMLPATLPAGDIVAIAGFSQLWLLQPLPELDVAEARLAGQWRFSPALRFTGWFSYRNSRVKQTDSTTAAIAGNQAPYMPRMSAEVKMDWFFREDNRLWMRARYLGARYDDRENRRQVGAYLLLNAGVEIRISRHVRVTAEGRNLLNATYSRWFGMTEPGINGYGGLRIVF